MKDLFILEPGVTYLNCANMSPLLRSVKEAGTKGMETRATPWKLASSDWFTPSEVLRGLAAQVFQTPADNIALVPSVSYGLATAAKNLKIQAGKSIIILERQFPSNVYVWQQLAEQYGLRIVTVRREAGVSFTESVLRVVREDTALVALPNCHWIDGAYLDLARISERARAMHASVVLDLSQSLGALPIDISAIDPDLAVSVGYKWLMGPYGLGYMYVAPRWHEVWQPLEYSWLTRHRSEDFTMLTDYTSRYRNGARKFDMGEFPQFNTMPMAIAALEQILEWGIGNIQSSLRTLTGKIDTYLGTSENVPERGGHIVAIPVEGRAVEPLKKRIAEQGIIVSYRDTVIRVSPHLYNDNADIERLLACL